MTGEPLSTGLVARDDQPRKRESSDSLVQVCGLVPLLTATLS